MAAPNRVDLTGEVFGRLAVLHDSGARSRCGRVLWACECDCGAVVAVMSHNLRSGNTRSCGCLQVDASVRTHSAARRGLTRCVRIAPAALTAAREAAGLTQRDVCDRTGLTPSGVAQYETGARRHCHPDVMASLAAALGAAPDSLTDRTPRPGRERDADA